MSSWIVSRTSMELMVNRRIKISLMCLKKMMLSQNHSQPREIFLLNNLSRILSQPLRLKIQQLLNQLRLIPLHKITLRRTLLHRLLLPPLRIHLHRRLQLHKILLHRQPNQLKITSVRPQRLSLNKTQSIHRLLLKSKLHHNLKLKRKKKNLKKTNSNLTTFW